MTVPTPTARPIPDQRSRRPSGSHAAVLTGHGTALPAPMRQREVWDDFFAPRLGHDRLAERIFTGCGVTTRHAVADPRALDVSGWTTGDRMRRYVPDARELGRAAVARALADARLAAADVGLFVVVSCTGYATPGLDIMIADDLGMPASVRRLIVGHMGCYAAIPGVDSAAEFVRAHGRPAVMLCVELPSLHMQPAGDPKDLQQLVSHALFADAAVAVVLEPDAVAGLEVLDTGAVTARGSAGLMTWEVTEHGFLMGLSPRVADVLALHVQDAIGDLLAPWDLAVADVPHWAVHPGGPKIVDTVAERLRLPESAVAGSREVLRENGNCSSGTVLMVLERTVRTDELPAGQPVVAMAFGPGLTLCSLLLRVR